ncbi:MAG: 5-aminoimidazole-4-carboxamide ribonucleotide transformylase [Chloroflexi bacterium RBG_16_56_11]|nr:MAG: 5-aminoimidazole-4-carboxamide ribonucleotide transformylase [Chloroflexi bacterium RBG_16_56_11]
MAQNEIALRYGFNPHQRPARVYVKNGSLPVRVLNGAPGYINMLDALNGWQLVKELKLILNLPAAASFKHVSPAGAAVGLPLNDTLKKAYFVDGMEESPLMAAYARARGADRVSSYGDFAALSDRVDVPTARLINREVSDGVIATGYEKAALDILKSKKGGKYLVLEIDPDYVPGEVETREVFGVQFEQRRNTALATPDILKNIVTRKKELPPAVIRDLVVATATIKYTQSNTIGFAVDGQAIGVGAGQQSRIHCTRLAADKANCWFLRQHPVVLGLRWRDGVGRAERNNAIDLYLQERLNDFEKKNLAGALEKVPPQLNWEEKRGWLNGLKGVSLSSDGMIPFRDTIDRAYQSGVGYVAQPGGSIRDDDVIKACDDYGMVMAFTGLRLFHH